MKKSYLNRFLEVYKNKGIIYSIARSLKYILLSEYKKKSLDNFKNEIANKDLGEIFKYFKTDKYFHGYHRFYEKFFQNIRNNNLNILELGVQRGYSSASFHTYFPNSNLYCIDIDYRKITFTSKRIKNFELDLRNKKKVSDFVSKYKFSFDLIIDDASHYQSCIIENLCNFLPALKRDGSYIIEDYRQPEIWNEKMDLPNEINISNLFKFIGEKKLFESNIINHSFQNDIFNRIKHVETFHGDTHASDIGILKF